MFTNEQSINALITTMLQNGEGVSDLLFVVGKPPLTENHGTLSEVKIGMLGNVLSNAHVEQIARHIINENERLLNDFAVRGSCDCSYSIESVARFRVNIFKQNGRHAVVMRKLQSAAVCL